jgi:hypothetical protein
MLVLIFAFAAGGVAHHTGHTRSAHVPLNCIAHHTGHTRSAHVPLNCIAHHTGHTRSAHVPMKQHYLDVCFRFPFFWRPVGLRLSLHQQCYGRGYGRRITNFCVFCQFQMRVSFLNMLCAVVFFLSSHSLLRHTLCLRCALWEGYLLARGFSSADVLRGLSTQHPSMPGDYCVRHCSSSQKPLQHPVQLPMPVCSLLSAREFE